MKNLKEYAMNVDKNTLLIIAGLIWGFAGFRVFTIGIGDVQKNNGNWIFSLVFAGVILTIFLKFIFFKMFEKHTRRIINSELQKHCVFSFFDLKSYCIMGFMIFFGVSVRAIGIFNPVYIGTFYIGLGGALFMAGVFFLKGGVQFKATKEKYTYKQGGESDEV